jgi:hypothetical protein
LDQLPLQLVSDLLRGRLELDGETMGPWLTEQRERIAARFRKETDTVWIEHRDGTVRAHFLVSWGILGSDDKPELGEDASRKDRLHAEAMERVELMRGLFPDGAGYGCQGYGHKFLPMPYDGTTKTTISRDSLSPVWATRINAFANRLIEWQLRPAEWADYLSQVSSVREDMTSVMRDLLRALIAHFKNKRKHKAVGARLNAKAWDSLRDKLGKGISLPQQAVDEWGFVTESLESNGQNNDQRIEQGFALSPYLKSQSDLFTGLNNFLNQAMPHLYLHCSDGKASIEKSRMLIESKMNEVGDNLVNPALVSHNLADAVAALPSFQREFRRLFGGRMPANQLDDQDRRERKIFDAVLPLLNAYLENPAAHWQEPERRARAKMWHAVDEVPRRLAVALASLEPDGINARILRQPDTWKNAPALWISLDSNEPLHVFSASGLVKPLLRHAVLDTNLDEEQRRELPRRWERVVLVSLFRGRALDQHAWLVPTYRLTSQDPSSDLEWLDQIPRPINEEQWIRSGLQVWNSAEIAESRKLLGVIGHFKILTAHLSSVMELVKEDDADREVLQAYIHRHQDEWSEIIQVLIDGTGAVVERFNRLTEEQRERRPFLVEAVSSVSEHFQDWLPPGLDSGEAVLSVDACTSWLDTATANIEALEVVGGALLLDSIIQTATLSVTE